MVLRLDSIFDALTPVRLGEDQVAYSVGRVSGHSGYFVGRDGGNRACILISVGERSGRRHAPIRLENLEVEFEVRSRITETSNCSEGLFTVIRCRPTDREIIRYFFSVAEAVLRMLGPNPPPQSIAQAVTHLARIFQRLLGSPTRLVAGLFGELLLIRHAVDPRRALASWRLQESSRFDFTAGDLRLDVKTTAGRSRSHVFSYDQCNPPGTTVALVASLFAERVSNGVSIAELLEAIENAISGNVELTIKLHEAVAGTLARDLQDSLSVRFDEQLAMSSLQFYDLRLVPAIRDGVPPAVSDVHFRSDLSGCEEARIGPLVEREPAVGDLLPRSWIHA